MLIPCVSGAEVKLGIGGGWGFPGVPGGECYPAAPQTLDEDLGLPRSSGDLL